MENMNKSTRGIKRFLRRDRFKWYLFRVIKSLREPFIRAEGPTVPVLIFGMQRSGTSMLLILFNMHPQVKVYSEHPNSSLFQRHRIRSIDCLREHIAKTRYPFLAAKPVCDSHMASEIMDGLSGARALWAIRDYRDSALSSINRFASPEPVFESICNDRIGETGWFGEGIPQEDIEILKSLYREERELSQFDLSCLVWWARNRSFFHQRLQDRKDVKVVSYEKLTGEINYIIRDISGFLDLDISEKQIGFIHGRSVGKGPYPELDSRVGKMCDQLYQQLCALA
ncbi:MAG: hypothetical protein GF417_11845 [Candidatus Latescibacteria bacterium]|nr:hypothetical protein [bacterium]MBD3425118.1 hypothetical protein [Candidatus Latescibacterota bacterium]